ncbi:MAG: hypothetical protein JWP63_2448 [Candidatus Solibacter sp.]|jgi:hypothetical protein|nr:hypothetical protein [Candidatus Solibacter sp.]
MSVAKFSHTRHQHAEAPVAAWIMIAVLIAITLFAIFTLLNRVG